jgi:predicted esterase
MTAAMNDQVTGYFAFIPVIDPGALSWFAGLKTPHFNPLQEIPRLHEKGFLAWGTKDEVVNFRLTEKLYEKLKAAQAPVTGIAYEGQDHSLNSRMIHDVLNSSLFH